MVDGHEVTPLGPLLWQHLKHYREMTAERPSVGTLSVPREVGELLARVTKAILSVCAEYGAVGVRVMCGRVTPSRLRLEVTFDTAWKGTYARVLIRILSRAVEAVKGELVTVSRPEDGIVASEFIRVTVPIAPLPPPPSAG